MFSFEDKDKNDYALINALLEDGTDQSIVKLKMVVDFEAESMAFNSGIISKIKPENRLKFIKLFKDYFSKRFEHNVRNIPEDMLIDIIKMFKKSFDEAFMRQCWEIRAIPEDKQIEVIKLCKKSFRIGFSNFPWEIHHICDKNVAEVKKMFPRIYTSKNANLY